MSHPKPEWLAAWADGELRGWRRWLVERHTQNCPACAAECRHQRHVRELLRQHQRPVTMREPPEFFWAQVRAEIERRETVPAPVPADSRYPLQLATVLAAIIVVVGWIWVAGPPRQDRAQGPVPAARPGLAVVETVNTPIPNTAATVLPAEEPHIAVVWISGLPWTRDMDEMMTVYADLES